MQAIKNLILLELKLKLMGNGRLIKMI